MGTACEASLAAAAVDRFAAAIKDGPTLRAYHKTCGGSADSGSLAVGLDLAGPFEHPAIDDKAMAIHINRCCGAAKLV